MFGFVRMGHNAGQGTVAGAAPPELVVTTSGANVNVSIHASAGLFAEQYSVTPTTLLRTGSSLDATTAHTFILAGAGYSIEAAHLARLEAASPPGIGAITRSDIFYSGQTGYAANAVPFMVVETQGRLLYVMARPGQSHLYTLFKDSGGTLNELRRTSDAADTYIAAPVAIASLQLSDRTLIFATSTNDPGVSAYDLTADGRTTHVSSLGALNGIGINQPSSLLAVNVGGQNMLLLGASGSSTITVMGVSATGQLSLLDHITDDLNTRFGGIKVMETATLNGQVFIVAGGSDDGLSLFTLMPNGQLVHLQSLADTTALGLANVNALALTTLGNTLHIFATSEAEQGVTHLTVEASAGQLNRIGTSGNDLLIGGTGSDMFWDGAGNDTLTGGAGADLFIFAEDGTLDEITDFTLGQDRADISGWAGLYSTAQLTITSQSDGALVTYGAEQLRIRTANNAPLTAADFLATDILTIPRISQNTDPPPTYAIGTIATGTSGNDVMSGGTLNDSLTGGAGNDTLTGDLGNDTLTGGLGADILYGGAGNDRLLGEDDSDLLDGGIGNDSLYGGGGHDTLLGGAGNDRLDGDTGADIIDGGDGSDLAYGGSSTDILNGGNGNDTLHGGTGADTIYGDEGDDYLYGNTGVDLVYGGGGNDWISPGDGADLVYGGSGNDVIIGRNGVDTLFGGAGNDTLSGSEGIDYLYGEEDDDVLNGGGGFDFLYGGDGNDELYGNTGSDLGHGGDGNDTLYGATGDDSLYGGNGDDVLWGNQGVDVLDGGPGNDLLNGGTQSDIFVFRLGHGHDRITDFEAADILRLDQTLIGTATTGAQVVTAYASVIGGTVVFDFGGANTITLENIDTLSSLSDAITIF